METISSATLDFGKRWPNPLGDVCPKCNLALEITQRRTLNQVAIMVKWECPKCHGRIYRHVFQATEAARGANVTRGLIECPECHVFVGKVFSVKDRNGRATLICQHCKEKLMPDSATSEEINAAAQHLRSIMSE